MVLERAFHIRIRVDMIARAKALSRQGPTNWQSNIRSLDAKVVGRFG
jgi:hypothetical protein